MTSTKMRLTGALAAGAVLLGLAGAPTALAGTAQPTPAGDKSTSGKNDMSGTFTGIGRRVG